jgi:hypothetical protein
MIRDMHKKDVNEVTALVKKFIAHSVYGAWPFNFGRTSYILETILGEDTVFAQVLETDNKIVGFFIGQTQLNEWVDCNIASDLGFYIEEEHRKGMGGVRLIKNFEAWAIENSDLIKLSVFAGVSNDKTSQLLDRMKFIPAGTIHKKEIKKCA